MTGNEAQVREMLIDWTKAISAGDRDAILAHHDDDLLMFDFLNTVVGIDAYDATWDFFFENQRGPITFEPSDIRVTAGGDVAFASCAIHCDGTSAGPLDLRLTMGLKKIDGRWVILHEHHSVPTTEDRYIDEKQDERRATGPH